MMAMLSYQARSGAGISRAIHSVEEAQRVMSRLGRPAELVDAAGVVIGQVHRLSGPDAQKDRKWGWWLDPERFS